MQQILVLCITFFFSILAKGQCADPTFHGYSGSDTISVSKAFQVLFSKHDFHDNCDHEFSFVAASVSIINKAGEPVYDKVIQKMLSDAERKTITTYMKPGNKLLIENIRYAYAGEVRYAPGIRLLLR